MKSSSNWLSREAADLFNFLMRPKHEDARSATAGRERSELEAWPLARPRRFSIMQEALKLEGPLGAADVRRPHVDVGHEHVATGDV